MGTIIVNLNRSPKLELGLYHEKQLDGANKLYAITAD
jgi:hypothetical protein